ncbi:MAG: DUF1194 domain-containing protein [Alphaproteobacteria bacterium]
MKRRLQKYLGPILAPVLGLALLLGLTPQAPATEVKVDLQLVLAVDSSGSIDDKEFALQRVGYAKAFRNPRVIRAIGNGFHRAIAVTYVEWSGPGIQVPIVIWTRINDAASADRFAAALINTPRAQISGHGTAVGEAILMASELFEENDYQSPRRIIDISGDGPTSRGRPASWARDLVIAQGITINGLPILDGRHGNLPLYFLDNVIGGPGSFSITANGFKDFAAAVLSKLIREIAGTEPSTEFAMDGADRTQ